MNDISREEDTQSQIVLLEEQIKAIEKDKRKYASDRLARLDKVIPTLPERRSMIDYLRDERAEITAEPVAYSDREILRLEKQIADIEKAELEKELKEDDGEVIKR